MKSLFLSMQKRTSLENFVTEKVKTFYKYILKTEPIFWEY